jgi:serine protease
MYRQRYLLLNIFLTLAFLQLNAQVKYFRMPEHLADSDYLARTIIFKIKPEFRAFCNENVIDLPKLNNVLTSIGAKNVVKKFPKKTKPETEFNKYGDRMADLSMIYQLSYTSELSLETAINKLLATGLLDYAEPYYLPHLLDAFNPSDPMADTTSSQYCEWHLKNIKAYEAWGIQKGDTNIVIGISDTGTQLFHPDLVGSIKINYADPINNLDDDGDGFKDNYYGWDLACNDSMPETDNHWHGIHVTGLASATVNNGIGLAGSGFKCRYLPIKVENASGTLINTYESIVYAVDHGCSIVNCSWGGYGGAGQFGQDIVNYATNNKNALVVAACGNSDIDYPMYPASYENVFSVAATNIHDCKWKDTINHSGSNYGINVDISAPGEAVWSTWGNGGYISSTGTSMSAPIVCGAAAIVKAHFPSYSATQIAAQLKASADNIDTIPFNAPYAGMLGAGRLNMFKALTSNSPWIEMTSNSITDNNDETFVAGDTLVISGDFKNYLSPSNSSLNVTVSTTNPYIYIVKPNSILGVINTLATKNITGAFKVKILSGVPASTKVDLKLTFNDAVAGYSSTQYFSVMVNVDYLDIDTNKVATTMTSKGKIGYNESSSLTQGIGFTYNKSNSFLSCGGFIVGNSTAQVSDDIYGSTTGSFENDFKTLKVVYKKQPPMISDLDAETVFSDSLAGSNKMSLTVRNNAYAWSSAPKDKFIIMEYTIKNNGIATLSSLYAGVYMDFDMGSDGTNDRIEYDPVNKMGYTYSTEGGTYAAISLVSGGIVHHYAFDNNGAFNGYATSINIYNGFNSYDKYSALKISNSDRNTAGIPDGNDVSDLLSTGPFILQHGDSVTVAFALIAGDHFADVQASAIAAYNQYNHVGVPENSLDDAIRLSDIFPNPSNNSVSVNVFLPASETIDLSLFDKSGKKIQTITAGKTQQGDHQFTLSAGSLTSGVYILRLSCGNKVISKDVTIIR